MIFMEFGITDFGRRLLILLPKQVRVSVIISYTYGTGFIIIGRT